MAEAGKRSRGTGGQGPGRRARHGATTGQRDPGPGWASGAVPQPGGYHGKGQHRSPPNSRRRRRSQNPTGPGHIAATGRRETGGEAAVTPREAAAMSPGPRYTATRFGSAQPSGSKPRGWAPGVVSAPAAGRRGPGPARTYRLRSALGTASAAVSPRPPGLPLPRCAPEEAGLVLTGGQSPRRGQYRAWGVAARAKTGGGGSQPVLERGGGRGRGRGAAGARRSRARALRSARALPPAAGPARLHRPGPERRPARPCAMPGPAIPQGTVPCPTCSCIPAGLHQTVPSPQICPFPVSQVKTKRQ